VRVFIITVLLFRCLAFAAWCLLRPPSSAGLNVAASASRAAKGLLPFKSVLIQTIFESLPQTRSLQGKTALIQAVGRGDVATVQVLVAAKANLEAKTSDVELSFPY
jgi:hypothetical protein